MRRCGATLLVVAVLLVSALALGLGAPIATASCAGPQLRLVQDGETPAPRHVGAGTNERVPVDIRRDRPVTLAGSNLTLECHDAVGMSPGCSNRNPPPPADPLPIPGANLVLTQRGREWSLGRLTPVGRDLSAEREIAVPAAARSGPATVELRDGSGAVVGSLDVVLH